jgi:hypothetical protein
MTEFLFSRDDSFYQRQINPISDYLRQSALYLHIMTGDNINDCINFIKKTLQTDKINETRDPVVVYFERQQNGDRIKSYIRLSQYIKDINNRNYILAPSFTCYLPPEILRSHMSDFVERNKNLRVKAKKEAFMYKAQKNIPLYIIKNNEQTNMKLSNNSVSGAFCTEGCVLHNPTGHSTLTSTTRTVSSIGNVTNERLVAGNRHYWSPDIALYNILSIIDNANFAELEEAMEFFQLAAISSEDVIECVLRSSLLYWRNELEIQKLLLFVKKLTPIQKAAFVYTGDLWHLRKHNSEFIRKFLTSLSEKRVEQIDNPKEKNKKLRDIELNLAYHICYDEIKGLEKNNLDKLEAAGVLNTLVATGLNIRKVFEDYSLFIKVFFLSKSIPPSLAYLKNMIRRSVVVSDTDSTCASYQEWIQWYRGSIIFDDCSMAISAGVMTLAAETISHTLAIFSANMGVKRSYLHEISMKNEFTWAMMCPTNVAKHYYALTVVQEGNVFEKPELEIKGVHLKNSSTGGDIIKKATRLIEEISKIVVGGKKISLIHFLKETAELEREIVKSLTDGELTFYRKALIKDRASYKLDDTKSPYQAYHFWREIFEEKYGLISPPPYSVIKLPTNIINKTALANWFLSMKDASVAEKAKNWCIKFNKVSLPTFYISVDFIKGNGLIEEFKSVLDTKRVVLDLMKAHYIILESIGFYKRNDSTLTELGY